MVHMANPNLTRETDPASKRLTPEQVIQIHLAHRRGEGWHSIADRFGTRWKNVSRIINGDRWAELHPSRRPDLYVDTSAVSDVDAILSDLDVIEAKVASIRAALGRQPAAGQMR